MASKTANASVLIANARWLQALEDKLATGNCEWSDRPRRPARGCLYRWRLDMDRPIQPQPRPDLWMFSGVA